MNSCIAVKCLRYCRVFQPSAATRDDADMRRRLLLIRHAKSAWDDSSLSDHDRPLAPRGLEALPRLCDHLARAECQAEMVLCSSSRRTVQTLDGIRVAFAERATSEVDPDLYLASAATLLARLRDVDSRVQCAMTIGHNPGMQELALLLVSAGNAGMREQLLTKFPTAAAATLSFDGQWADLSPGTARIDDLFMPRKPR
jgi:phosphohistidine phosphatase